MSQEPLKAQFFVTRPNGNMVPLVAMDELPPTISIRNVARTLSPHDITGMTAIGTFETRHLQHTVDLPAQSTQRALLDRSLMASKFAGSEHHFPSPSPAAVSYQGPPKAYGIQEQPPSSPGLHPVAGSHQTSALPTPANQRIDRNANPLAQQPLPPWHDPSVLPKPQQNAPGVKEYCSYWLRHGECDYAQQGCLYKHEMPLDKATLLRLGHRDIPRWYREKHGIGSFLAVSSGEGTIDIGKVPNDKLGRMDRDWRDISGNKISQRAMETMRSSLSRMGIGASNRAGIDETGNPSSPPTTPQMGLQQLASTNPRSRIGEVKASSSKQPTQTMKSSYSMRTVETMQQRQNRKTIEESNRLEAEQRRRQDALGPNIRIKSLGIDTGPATAPEMSRSATSSSASSVSATAATTVDMGTPATSTEESESETTDLLSSAESPAPATKTMTVLKPTSKSQTPKLLPTKTGQLVKSPKSTSTGAANHGKKRASKKARARKVAASSDGLSAGGGRKRSLMEAGEPLLGEFKGYDHDD